MKLFFLGLGCFCMGLGFAASAAAGKAPKVSCFEALIAVVDGQIIEALPVREINCRTGKPLPAKPKLKPRSRPAS